MDMLGVEKGKRREIGKRGIPGLEYIPELFLKVFEYVMHGVQRKLLPQISFRTVDTTIQDVYCQYIYILK